jgi:hypothetical protein
MLALICVHLGVRVRPSGRQFHIDVVVPAFDAESRRVRRLNAAPTALNSMFCLDRRAKPVLPDQRHDARCLVKPEIETSVQYCHLAVMQRK